MVLHADVWALPAGSQQAHIASHQLMQALPYNPLVHRKHHITSADVHASLTSTRGSTHQLLTVDECHILSRQRQAHRPLLRLVQAPVEGLPRGRCWGKGGRAPAEEDIHKWGCQASLALTPQALHAGGEVEW